MLTRDSFFSTSLFTRPEQYAFGRMRQLFDPWFDLTPEGEAEDYVDAMFDGWVYAERKEVAELQASDPNATRLLVSMRRVPPFSRHDDAPIEDHPALLRLGHLSLYGGVRRKFDPTSHLRAPLWVGDDCSIRLSAKAIGPALIGAGVLIGSSSSVTRSIIGAKSEIDDGAKIRDSLVGRNVYIGPDAKVLNKLELTCPVIRIPDWREESGPLLDTGRVRFGAVIGDGCVIGAGAILYPGVVLFPGCRIQPGQIVQSGVYTPEILAKRRAGAHHPHANGRELVAGRAVLDP